MMSKKHKVSVRTNGLVEYNPPSLDAGDKPTFDMYGFIQVAYDYFNAELFNQKLPQCLLTFQREKNVFGYFCNDRWEGKAGSRHEIALNPYYFITHKPLELFQTIVHEMCHLWQHEYGKPSRSGYHNKEWADKMESIGLMPSDTGEPGGKRTGQKMGDYPIDNGKFYQICLAFNAKGHSLPYVDKIRYNTTPISQPHNADNLLVPTDNAAPIELEISLLEPFSEQFELDESVIQEQEAVRAAKQKTIYQCPVCADKAWGKPTLNLVCGNCDVPFAVMG